MLLQLEAFFYDEDGAGLVEYGLVVAVVGLGIYAVLASLGQDVGDILDMTTDHIEAAMTQEDPVEVAKRKVNRRWHSKNFASPTPSP